jgi:hypothetical protein
MQELLQMVAHYPVTPVAEKSFWKLLRNGPQDRINPLVTVKNFPVPEKPLMETEITLYRQIAPKVETLEVVARMDKDGRQPVGLLGFSAFGATYPELVRSYGLTLALDCRCSHPENGCQTCLSYWMKGDECVLTPSYCGVEGTFHLEGYETIAYLAMRSTAPLMIRENTLGLGWFEWCNLVYPVRTMSKGFAAALPYFAGFPEGTLIISEEIPEQFRTFVMVHEVECFKRGKEPGRCLLTTQNEIGMVPPPWRAEYAAMRMKFYEALLAGDNDGVEKELVPEIQASMEYLRQLR